jgi:hypothetical protein
VQFKDSDAALDKKTGRIAMVLNWVEKIINQLPEQQHLHLVFSCAM